MNNQVLAPGCRRVSTYKTLDNLDSGQNNKLKEVMEDTSSLDSSRANRIYDVKVTRYKNGQVVDEIMRRGSVLYDLSLYSDEALKKLKNKFKNMSIY